MQAIVEVLSSLERKLTVTTPPENIDQEVEKQLKEMIPKIKMDGFRPGKVPMHVLRKRFAPSIRYDVLEKIIESTYREAISKENLTPAGLPEIKVIQDKAGEPLQYQAILEIYPEVTLQSLASVELETLKVNIAEKDIDDMIEKLRRQEAEWTDVDRASQMGDRVVISYEGRQDGVLFEGGTAKEVFLELGSGKTTPGFEEGFVGHKSGDTVVFNVTFPADYHVASLAGKTVEFSGTVHKVQIPELLPLDDAFTERLGVKEGGLTQLRNDILRDMHRDVEHKVQEYSKAQILKKLLELHPIEIPKVLIQEELKKLQEEGRQQVSEEPSEALRALAKRRVHLGILFNELMREQKFTVDPEHIDKLIEKITAAYEDSALIARAYRENKNLYQHLEAKTLEDQLIEHLIAQTKQIEKNIQYHELNEFNTPEEEE